MNECIIKKMYKITTWAEIYKISLGQRKNESGHDIPLLLCPVLWCRGMVPQACFFCSQTARPIATLLSPKDYPHGFNQSRYELVTTQPWRSVGATSFLMNELFLNVVFPYCLFPNMSFTWAQLSSDFWTFFKTKKSARLGPDVEPRRVRPR